MMHKPLVTGSGLLLAISIVHDLDHARQGRPLPGALSAIGAIGLISAVASLAFALRGNRFAPLVAAYAGLSSVGGLVLIHLVPHWSGWFSDPYSAAHVDALSWSILFAMMAAGAYLGVAALRAVRSAPSYR